MNATHCKRRLAERIRAEMTHLSGRRCHFDLEAPAIAHLCDLHGLLRDLEAEKDNAVRQTTLFPWQTH